MLASYGFDASAPKALRYVSTAFNVLAVDERLEYARLFPDRNMPMWADAEDSLI